MSDGNQWVVQSAPAVGVKRLVRLPNGVWVRPDEVKYVRPMPTSEGLYTGALNRARVIVEYSRGNLEEMLANDNEHAVQMADDIAQRLNEANTEVSRQTGEAG